MVVENNPYPQDTRVRCEAEALTEAGLLVSVIAPAGQDQAPREVVEGVYVFRYPAPRSGNGLSGYAWEYGFSLAKILILSAVVFRERGFDVIHVANPPDLLGLVGLLYRPWGRKLIFDHHDLAPEMFDARFQHQASRWMRSTLLFLERMSCRLSSHVVTANEAYRSVLIERAGVPAHRISVVRNGPDMREITQVTRTPPTRRPIGITVGYIGIFGPQDGVDRLLRAVAYLRHVLKRTDLDCVLIGDGSEGSYLRALATELRIDDVVEFTGFLPHLTALHRLARADIGVVPDPSNPYNDCSTMIKVLDYMALGIPLVAFDMPEHRSSAGQAALYVRPNDDVQLATGIASLMDDPDARRRMATIGQERIKTGLSWQHSVPHLLAAYDRVLGQAASRRQRASA